MSKEEIIIIKTIAEFKGVKMDEEFEILENTNRYKFTNDGLLRCTKSLAPDKWRLSDFTLNEVLTFEIKKPKLKEFTFTELAHYFSTNVGIAYNTTNSETKKYYIYDSDGFRYLESIPLEILSGKWVIDGVYEDEEVQ